MQSVIDVCYQTKVKGLAVEVQAEVANDNGRRTVLSRHFFLKDGRSAAFLEGKMPPRHSRELDLEIVDRSYG